jgi:hypothetical protein
VHATGNTYQEDVIDAVICRENSNGLAGLCKGARNGLAPWVTVECAGDSNDACNVSDTYWLGWVSLVGLGGEWE